MARWRVGNNLPVNWGADGKSASLNAYCVLPNNYVILTFPQLEKAIGEVNYVYMCCKASDPCTREEIILYQALGFKTCGGRWLEYQQNSIARYIHHIHQFERKNKLHPTNDYFNHKEL